MATIYISHPDGEDLDATRRKLASILRDIEKSGNVGISPLIILRDIVDWSNEDRRIGASFDLLKSCDYMWIMTPEITKIMRREIEFASCHAMEIRFFDNLHWELTKDKGWEAAESRLLGGSLIKRLR